MDLDDGEDEEEVDGFVAVVALEDEDAGVLAVGAGSETGPPPLL